MTPTQSARPDHRVDSASHPVIRPPVPQRRTAGATNSNSAGPAHGEHPVVNGKAVRGVKFSSTGSTPPSGITLSLVTASPVVTERAARVSQPTNPRGRQLSQGGA